MQNGLFILGQLTDEDVEWILATGGRRDVPGGAILIREGVPTDALYIILDGTLIVSLAALPGQEFSRLGVGEIVGEMSFVDARPPSATVSAQQPTVVLAIDREQLRLKLEQDSAFAARFYRALAIFLSDRLRWALGQVATGRSPLQGRASPDEDELDPNVLDNVHLAGARFSRILERLMGAEPPTD